MATKLKAWYLSKTLWLAVIQGVLGILVVVIQENPELGGLLILKSILDMLLRFLTEKPIV